MSDAKKIDHCLEFDDFEYEGSSRVVELEAKDYENLKSKLVPRKNYILKDNTGREFIANNTDEVAQFLNEKNISEVLVEEVSTENAKVSRIKMNNSHFDIDNKVKAKLELVQNKSLPFLLSFELGLNNGANVNLVNEKLSEIKNTPARTTNSSVFTSKQKIKKKSSSIYKNFFRMKNNSEVFKLGKGFLTDYSQGKKCFGFAAMDNVTSMVNTVYGITSFFNFYCHLNGLLFLNDEEFEQISKYVPFKSTIEYDDILDKEYCIWHAEGMSVITYSTFDKESRGRVFDFFERKSLGDEVLLCSLPSSQILLEDIELYFQILQKIDNVSFVVKKNESNLNDIKKSVSFLENYKVKIKGIICG